MRRTAIALLVTTLFALPAPAFADDDVRVSGTCGNGARSSLRAEADDGAIRVRFRVDGVRAGKRWRVALIHERRVVWRGRVRARSGSVRVRRSIPNYSGADQIGARASGPRGNSCSASAVLAA